MSPFIVTTVLTLAYVIIGGHYRHTTDITFTLNEPMKGDSTLKTAILIGKSMSLCIRDILKGIVSLDQVILLDAGTMVNTCDKLTGLVRYYNDIYWKDWDYEQCLNVVETLLFTHRLRQERVMPRHDGNHLERSLTLHEKRFGINHGKHDVIQRLHYDDVGFIGEEGQGELKLGDHWEVIDVVDSNICIEDDETKTMDEVITGLVDELKDIAHGRHEKCWD